MISFLISNNQFQVILRVLNTAFWANFAFGTLSVHSPVVCNIAAAEVPDAPRFLARSAEKDTLLKAFSHLVDCQPEIRL
jgi:hypothetical protein